MRIRFHFLLLGTMFAALGGIGLPVAAQDSGAVTGQVRDTQGQPLEGVAIKLMRAGKPDVQEQASNAEGSFRFGGLEGGVYIASVNQEEYAPVTCPGLRIVGLTRQVEITLAAAGGETGSSCKEAAEQ